jgi:plasmid stabilization system protein ParE
MGAWRRSLSSSVRITRLKLSYYLHSGAEFDLAEAVLFYKREGGARLVKRFLEEFKRVAKLLDDYPYFGTAAGGERRIYPLHTFPYSLIYRPTNLGVRILVIRHQRRDPQHGQERK